MIARKGFVTMLVSLCVLTVASAFSSVPAFAAVEHKFEFSFDGSETPAGKLGVAGGVAVADASGDVYVSDIENKVIDKFGPEGKYLCQVTGATVPSATECAGLTGSATPAGELSLVAPAQIAIDNSTEPGDSSAGDLYVLDASDGVIDKFNPAGEYVAQLTGPFAELLGIGVDGAGHVWVYEGNGEIEEFGATGELLSQFSTGFGSTVADFAVDSSGDTYAARGSGVDRFDSKGDDLGSVQECGFCQAAIAVDHATDDAYIDDKTEVNELSPAGDPISQFGVGQLSSGGEGGIAVNGTSGVIYVSNANAGKVYAFGPTPGPRAMTGPASEVSVHNAKIAGLVNPGGSSTSYAFEYGTSTAYGTTAPITPQEVGSGNTFVPVSVAVANLEGGTTYHYRLVATNTNGVVYSADHTFSTTPVPVVLSTEATALTDTSAVLHAVIDTRGLATTFHFEWGETAEYGNVVPEPDESVGSAGIVTVKPVEISLHKSNVTYHWRVVATDANGTTVGV
ncbi:MAG TPA: hypothetical protein VK781_07675, partial [Solirubrobacteraceae bacterium]|nr:hypothetical protein [Solirubrobacteraceae bacterium]